MGNTYIMGTLPNLTGEEWRYSKLIPNLFRWAERFHQLLNTSVVNNPVDKLFHLCHHTGIVIR